MKAIRSIYDQAIDITEEYLGPAARRFLDRQILAHLDKDPELLSRADLGKLMDWLEASVALLTDDQTIVNEFCAKLRKLSKDPAGAK